VESPLAYRAAALVGWVEARGAMCTLILLDRVVPDFPVIVAANRDEFFARPAAPPARFAAVAGRPAFVAPQDLEAGGTWMGLNAKGLFVGLTNRPVAVRDPSARSRGLLVVDSLGAESAEAATSDLLRGERYAPFNLLAADGRETRLARLRDGDLDLRPLDPGIHVVCNRDREDPTSAKVRRLEARLAELDLSAGLEKLMIDLVGVLGSHRDASNSLENPCVHSGEYGTRSASVLAVGKERSAWRYADGPPCETKFHDFSRLLGADAPQAKT
jgi:uncharacterized protein with NRDE domain